MADLKPCPFCGSDRINVFENEDSGEWHVDTLCGIDAGAHHHSYVIAGSKAEAIEAWNRRADERKCSECEERQGHYLDAETIQRQQEHIAELEREGAAAFYNESYTLDENRKLRELVRDMLTCEDHHCADCECNDSGGKREMKSCFTAQRFAKRAMDMGIEVE